MRSMTRTSIEFAIKVFIVLLVATFLWTLYRVLGGMLGWL